jgi:uncharacterized membrane protein
MANHYGTPFQPLPVTSDRSRTMRTLTVVLAVVAAVGTAAMGGTFFAFSTFVMRSLAKRPAPEGIAAMQEINRTILGSAFMPVFLGTAVLCVATGVIALVRWSEPGSAYLLVGSVLYLAGNLLVTGAYNVPLNNALDALDPTAVSAAEWVRWVARWQLGNHARTLTGLAATTAFALAARG